MTRIETWGTALAGVAIVAAITAISLHRPPVPDQAALAIVEPAKPSRQYRLADFAGEQPSADARSIANWITDSGDNRGMAFVIVDKVDARVFVFDAKGHLKGATPVLLGLARGDDTVPGIGDKKLSQILPHERTTPAGRFIGERGVNLTGEEIVWVDYDAAVSMHAVRSTNPRERRLQRLATPTPADNRISYGCINVPLDFFRNVVAPTFRRSRAVVYVLPETRPARVVFNAYDVPGAAPTLALGAQRPHP